MSGSVSTVQAGSANVFPLYIHWRFDDQDYPSPPLSTVPRPETMVSGLPSPDYLFKRDLYYLRPTMFGDFIAAISVAPAVFPEIMIFGVPPVFYLSKRNIAFLYSSQQASNLGFALVVPQLSLIGVGS